MKTAALALSFLAGFGAYANQDPHYCNSDVPTLQVPNIPDSPDEAHGFVTVPQNWLNPLGPSVRIFYRRVGTDPSKPLLVLLNGGPGMSTHKYLSFDHSKGFVLDMAKHFRLLMFDQRGTGYSVPVDQTSPKLDPEVLARCYGAPQHALDAEAVVRAWVPRSEKLYLLAFSYGGLIGYNYLTLDGLDRLPDGVIFASPVALYSNESHVQRMYSSRLAQRKMNEQLQSVDAGLPDRILALQQRIADAGYVDPENTTLRPHFTSIWWRQFGRDSGLAATLKKWLSKMLDSQMPIEEIAKDIFSKFVTESNLLAYAIRPTAELYKKTDQMLSDAGKSFAPWMLEEVGVSFSYENQKSFRGGKFVDFFAKADRLVGQVPTLPEKKKLIGRLEQIPSLFLVGDSDVQIPLASAKSNYEGIGLSSKSTFVVLPKDGHMAPLAPEGIVKIQKWLGIN